MASYFFDTSALAKRYISEHGSSWVISTCHRDAGHAILISRVTSVELISALAKAYRQRLIDEQQRTYLTDVALRDVATQYRIVSLLPTVLRNAEQLLDTFVTEGLRAYDAIQLASALYANRTLQRRGEAALTFVTSDRILGNVAQQNGLLTDDPTHHP